MFFCVYLYLEKRKVIFYTAYHEDSKPIFFASINCNIYNVAADFDGLGMDDANHVDDEVFIKVRR